MKQVWHIIGSVSRTLLAFTFLFSGFVKAIDPLGTVHKVRIILLLSAVGLIILFPPLYPLL